MYFLRIYFQFIVHFFFCELPIHTVCPLKKSLFLVDSYRIIVDCNICLLITLHILFSRLHLFICGVLSKEVFHCDAVKFINLFICQFLLFVILLKFQKYIFLYAYFFDLQPNQTFFCSAVRLVFDFIISNQKTF